MNTLLKTIQLFRHKLDYIHNKTVALPYSKWKHTIIDSMSLYSVGNVKLYR